MLILLERRKILIRDAAFIRRRSSGRVAQHLQQLLSEVFYLRLAESVDRGQRFERIGLRARKVFERPVLTDHVRGHAPCVRAFEPPLLQIPNDALLLRRQDDFGNRRNPLPTRLACLSGGSRVYLRRTQSRLKSSLLAEQASQLFVNQQRHTRVERRVLDLRARQRSPTPVRLL